LEEKLSKEYEIDPRRREGVREGRWAVLDYSDVIVHVFCDDARDFYHLERLWESGNNLIRYED
jgi:ribosome-associated protein